MQQKREKLLEFLLCLCDCLVALVSFWIAGFIRYRRFETFNNIVDIAAVMFVTVIVTLASFYIVNAFEGFFRRGRLREALKVLQLNICILIGMSIYTFSTKNAFALSRLTLAYLLMINTVLDLGTHLLVKRFLRRHLAKQAVLNRRILLFAHGGKAEAAIKRLKRHIGMDCYVMGVVLLDGGDGREEIAGIPVVATMDDYLAYATGHVIDEALILSDDQKANEEVIRRIISNFELMGVAASLQIETVDTGLGEVQTIGRVGDYHVVTFSTRVFDSRQLLLKRLIDIAGSLVGLLLATLIGIVVGPFLLLESPGPLLFSQERVGRNGRTFKIYKFRSMCVGAEEMKDSLQDKNEMKGKIFKIKEDPRVTRVGAFIRRTSLDEFPQFWNVLRGDMSLVGTRPPTLDEYAKYTHLEKRRLSFRPGITGLWQISGRSDVDDFDEIVRMDIEYIENWSNLLDIEILLKTVVAVFRRKGAA